MELPRCEEPMAACADVQAQLHATDLGALAHHGLHESMDDLQTGLAVLHDRLTTGYFRRPSRSDALAVA
jgi:hypothetical protein